MYIFKASISLFLLLLTTQIPSLEALPAQVLLIRHGEKPSTGDDLSLKGYERAQALMPYFMGTPEVTRYGTPVAIFAQRPCQEQPSKRALETVSPLAQALGFQVNTGFKRDEYRQMVEAILSNRAYDGKVVLVCWEHSVIPHMASDFGAHDAPTKWASGTFDRVWALTYSASGKVHFEDIPQLLMYGDSSSLVLNSHLQD